MNFKIILTKSKINFWRFQVILKKLWANSNNYVTIFSNFKNKRNFKNKLNLLYFYNISKIYYFIL